MSFFPHQSDVSWWIASSLVGSHGKSPGSPQIRRAICKPRPKKKSFKRAWRWPMETQAAMTDGIGRKFFGKPKTRKTLQHFNTSSPGSQKRMAHAERYLGPSHFCSPPPQKKAFRMQYPSVPSNWSCLPPPSGNYRSCQQPGRSHKHPGKQTTEVTSSAWHLWGMFRVLNHWVLGLLEIILSHVVDVVVNKLLSSD